MDTIAMWIGYLVMGISSGIFVIGGGMAVADQFARRAWKKLRAAHQLCELQAYVRDIEDRTSRRPAQKAMSTGVRMHAPAPWPPVPPSRRGDPVIPQPKPWRKG